MEISSLSQSVSVQASAQASAKASLQLLQQTLALQAAGSANLAQVAAPVNPPNLGNRIDVMA